VQRADEGRGNSGVRRVWGSTGSPRHVAREGQGQARRDGAAGGPWEEERGRGMQRNGEEQGVPGGERVWGDSLRGAA